MKLKLLAPLGREEDRGTLCCPFCKDPIYPALTVIRCTFCRTVYHEKCWHDNRRCSVFGCRGEPQQEQTEFYLIESFQKRRKKLTRSWYISIIITVLIVFFMSYSLKNIMPIEGAVLFSSAVALFIMTIIVLDGYAQYLCPACGHQPRLITREKSFFAWPIFQHYDIIHSRLLWNPTNCPTCNVRLR